MNHDENSWIHGSSGGISPDWDVITNDDWPSV